MCDRCTTAAKKLRNEAELSYAQTMQRLDRLMNLVVLEPRDETQHTEFATLLMRLNCCLITLVNLLADQLYVTRLEHADFLENQQSACTENGSARTTHIKSQEK